MSELHFAPISNTFEMDTLLKSLAWFPHFIKSDWNGRMVLGS